MSEINNSKQILNKNNICLTCGKPKTDYDPRGITYIGEFPYCLCKWRWKENKTITFKG